MTLSMLAETTSLIALDWGTSSLRAYRMGAGGRVLECRRLPWGIMNLPMPQSGDGTDLARRFEIAFEAACGDWLKVSPRPSVVACGMVGSVQGWLEAQYVELPANAAALGQRMTRLDRGDAEPVHIIPGLIQREGLPNVMRGEETQVMGVLASLSAAQLANQDVLIGLPGTHCKWVTVRAGQIIHFLTFMTGEVYAALREHTILGRTMEAPTQPNDAAFARGVQVAGSQDGKTGVLSTIFSCRTLGLTGGLANTEQADYLSGVLIGHEVASLTALHSPQTSPLIVLCGESDLCRRYAQALEFYGFHGVQNAQHATEHGLWQLAMAASLVS